MVKSGLKAKARLNGGNLQSLLKAISIFHLSFVIWDASNPAQVTKLRDQCSKAVESEMDSRGSK